MVLAEGWYLMSAVELEKELPHIDDPSRDGPVGSAIPLSVEDALTYKRDGNLPDPFGRSLRLVLRTAETDPEAIARRRLDFEPDFHDAPTWRRPGSKPVNVIPLRARSQANDKKSEAWWDDPIMAELEAEWRERGTVGGVTVPGRYRSFVLKTVASLRVAGLDVTADSIADSIERWVPPADAVEIRSALRRANSAR